MTLSWLHLAVLTPFLFAILVPFIYKMVPRIHTGWFVLAVPIALFVYFTSFFPLQPASPTVYTFQWIPQLNIEFTVHLDSLALLFSLIITGIGSLVVFYSIYYMSKEREALHQFYVYQSI